MKKFFFLFIPVVIFPYTVAGVLLSVFLGNSLSKEIDSFSHPYYLCVLMFGILSIVCSIVLFIISRKNQWDANKLFFATMLLKLIHIPAYIIMSLFELLACITIAMIPLALMVFLIEATAILSSGLIGLSGILVCLKKEQITKNKGIFFGIGQFLFFLDVIFAAVLYVVSKKSKHNNHL